MAKERVKKKSFQQTLEEIKEKMKEKRNNRLASASAPNRGRSRMIKKNCGTNSTHTILMGVKQNNTALAVALQAEKEKVRQANAVILQLRREQQALFLHLLLLKKKFKEQEAISTNSSENKSTNCVQPQSLMEPQRQKCISQNLSHTLTQEASPVCADIGASKKQEEAKGDRPMMLPSTVGVRRRHTDRNIRRRSERVREFKETTSEGCLATLTASPISRDDTNQRQTLEGEDPVLADPIEEYQHSTPEPAPAKSTNQPQPGRKQGQQTRTKQELPPKKPERGRKAERGPLKKPWENPKQRARSKSRDRTGSRTKTTPTTQNNKLNTSQGFNDTFDFDCEEAVHLTPFKAKAEDNQPPVPSIDKESLPKEQAEALPVVSKWEDSPLSPSSESEDSLYVPQKTRKKETSFEKTKAITTRRGRLSKKDIHNENICPQQEFSVFSRNIESSPTVKRSEKEEISEWKSPDVTHSVCLEQGRRIEQENQTDHKVDIKEHCLPAVSPLVKVEMMRIDNVLSNFGDGSSDGLPPSADQTPQRVKPCKKGGLVVRPAGGGMNLCDVTNLSPAAYRKFPYCGSRLSDARCASPGRKRRRSIVVDYKEPSLNAKLRRGDKFTDLQFLSSPVFKQKSDRRSGQKSRNSMKMQQPLKKYNESFVGCL